MDKSNTKTALAENGMDISEAEMPQLGEKLEKELLNLGEGIDLEKSAREDGALLRRRGVSSAVDLLRIVMAYSHLDFSLRMLGMWCVLRDLCAISKTALYHRLQKCEVWLGKLVVTFLLQRKLLFPAQGQIRIRLIDASVICQPGSKEIGRASCRERV